MKSVPKARIKLDVDNSGKVLASQIYFYRLNPNGTEVPETSQACSYNILEVLQEAIDNVQYFNVETGKYEE